MTRTRWIGLAVFLGLAAVAALVGALGVDGTTSTYAELDKPAWAPPSWLFGPVWTVLYVMIGISGWLVWARHGVHWSLTLWAVQLVLNALWTPIFFGEDAYRWAVVDIVALWIVIGILVAVFARLSRAAAWLLVPYWLWVTYAAALNISIAANN
ncbi:TspO/MBR family protein [Actinomadura flavalba]|uniref:TspO/MBR family protein n=1 Tax=Actinomadura flavalba TaxID=1120938 RepID=UPI00036FFE13|nr:TspO/MBR family protein [Actinomadura flavalba]